MVGELKKSAFFVIVYLVLDSIFKVDYLVSSEYSELNFLLQFIYVIVVIIVFKFKYYTAWSLSTSRGDRLKISRGFSMLIR